MEAQIVEFPIDHIKPRTAGGQSSLENLPEFDLRNNHYSLEETTKP